MNVFGLWKHNFWWNILHTQSNYGGKVPEFSAKSLSASVRGWQLVAIGVTWHDPEGSCDTASNWCHMIQKAHVTPTATSCHPLTKAEWFCQKFGNFSTIIWLYVQNVSSQTTLNLFGPSVTVVFSMVKISFQHKIYLETVPGVPGAHLRTWVL